MNRAQGAFCLIVTIAVAGFVLLVVASGLDRIAAGLEAVGWVLGALVLLRLMALALAGLAWRVAMGAGAAGWEATCVVLRVVRESINALLPVGQVGGDLVGGQLLAGLGFPLGLAGAGILVDLLLQVVSQALFAAFGLVVMWDVFGGTPLVREAGGGLLLAVPALFGFYLAQRLGLFAIIERLARAFGGKGFAHFSGGETRIQGALQVLYRNPTALGGAFLLHLVAWSVGIGEVWLALARITDPPPVAECIVLEALGQAIRSVAFVVPWALGVQEGGYIALGALFGLSPGSAIALSLAKRLTDLAIGIPGLILWRHLAAMRPSQQPAFTRS